MNNCHNGRPSSESIEAELAEHRDAIGIRIRRTQIFRIRDAVVIGIDNSINRSDNFKIIRLALARNEAKEPLVIS